MTTTVLLLLLQYYYYCYLALLLVFLKLVGNNKLKYGDTILIFVI